MMRFVSRLFQPRNAGKPFSRDWRSCANSKEDDMKVEIKAEGVEPYTIDVLKMADRLNDIAQRLNVVHLAIEGAAAEPDTPLLRPVMTFVSEIRGQIIAVSNDVHHSPAQAAGGAS
jgi:hypothetical protein